MQSLNPLGKMQKSSPKKVIGQKLLHTEMKEQKIYFSVTFLLINVSFLQLFHRTPSQH